MTAITFPNSPSSGDTHTAGNGIVYTYDGEKWTSIGTHSAGTWTRSGTTVSLTNAGDDLNVDSDTFFVDASTNNVGINTSSPAQALHLKGSYLRIDDASQSLGTIHVGAENGVNTIYSQAANGGAGAQPIRFVIGNSSEKLRISSSGNVGINEASPEDYGANYTTLETSGTYGGVFQSSSTDNSLKSYWYSDKNAGNARIGTNTNHPFLFTTNTVERMRIQSTGHVNIGTTIDGLVTYGDNLTIEDSSHCGMTIRSGGTSYASIYFADGTSGPARYAGYVEYNHNSNYMRFGTVGAERMRFDSAGKMILPTGSPGIQFGSSNTGTNISSQTLDDYEEGTWTPTVVGTTTTGTASYSNQHGQYVKIGNLVTLQMYISWTNGTGVGSMQIHGLPFSPANPNNSYGACAIGYWHLISISSGYMPSLFIDYTNNLIHCYQIAPSGISASVIPYPSSGGGVILTTTYRTD